MDRLNWLAVLNETSCWIKEEWETSTGKALWELMQRSFAVIERCIELVCLCQLVWNKYFLMLFARKEFHDLNVRLAEFNVGAFSWRSIDGLEKERCRQRKAEGAAEVIRTEERQRLLREERSSLIEALQDYIIAELSEPLMLEVRQRLLAEGRQQLHATQGLRASRE